METEFNKDIVMSIFETLADRLSYLEGKYAWNQEIELIRKALEEAGY